MKMNSKRWQLLPAVICLIIFSCKKNADAPTQTGNPPAVETVDKYLVDTRAYLPTGLVPATEAELLDVPVLNIGALSEFGKNEKEMSLDPSFDLNTLVPGVPPPGDQDSANNCSAWAVGYGMMGYLYGIKGGYSDYNSDDRKFSPSFIYNQVIKERPYDGSDHGIKLISALQFVKFIGCCKWTDMLPTNLYKQLPSDNASANATHFRITNYWRLGSNNIIDSIKTVINKRKLPVIFAINVDSGFKYIYTKSWETRKGNRSVWKESKGPFIGAHSMIIIGYDDEIKAFKVQNTWWLKGIPYIYPWKPWGPNSDGYCWIDYDLFLTAVLREGTEPEIFVGNLESPTIATTPATTITSTSTTTGGNITTTGNNIITARGICWSTTINPTISGYHFTNGADIGSFENTITGLNPGTTYHVRAYATTGAGTAYGNDISFITAGNGNSGNTTDSTVTDKAGNTYRTVKIGDQVWMAENLRTHKYRNGDTITWLSDYTQWAGLTTGAWGLIFNYATNYNGKFGKLYNAYAIQDPRGLAPEGWHIPTDAEWATLINYLGGDTLAYAKMKVNSNLWNGYGNGTNSSGFSGLPGGLLAANGNIEEEAGAYGFWWSTTRFSNFFDDLTVRYLGAFDNSVGRTGKALTCGASIRCVKD